jgi:membrane protein
MSKAWTILKHTVKELVADDVMTLAGALAFYTALSLSPLLVLVLSVAGFVWQESEVRAELIRRAHDLVGPTGAAAIEALLREAGGSAARGPAAVFGIATLLFAATGAFAQLQFSLNRIWNVETRPGQDVADFLRKRALSLGMILAVALLLVVSLIASTTMRFLWSATRFQMPGGAGMAAVVDLLGSLVVYTGIFTLVHHTLPDVRVAWKDGLVGGAVTAVLFAIGKEVLTWYLGSQSFTSAYGAAGSFFVVLVWVYYSSLILFVGAELTQAFALEMGHPVEPDPHARFVRPDGRDASPSPSP